MWIPIVLGTERSDRCEMLHKISCALTEAAGTTIAFGGVKVKCKRVPIDPGFVVSVHKAQGKTM